MIKDGGLYGGIIVEHNGKKFEVDYDGYLYDFFQYSNTDLEDWYDYVRMKEGIPEITPEHREVLKYFQDYFRKNGIAPTISRAPRELKKSKKSILKLFYPSKNPNTTIWVMAGLPRPIS